MILNGLCQVYAGGYDISSDAAAISKIGGGPAVIDTSTLDTVGMKRLAGRFNGEFDVNILFDPDVAHIPFSALPTTAAGLMAAMPGTTAGDIVAMLMAKYVDYPASIDNALAATFAVQAQASEGAPLEWGQMITAGKRTDTTATASGTGFTLPVPAGVPTVTVTGASAASPTHVTATAHGLITGDSIIIAGSNKSPLNVEWTVTVLDANTFTVPLDLTGGAATGGTLQRTSYHGWSAVNEMFAVVGTNTIITIQDSHDAVTGDFANLTGGVFTSVLAGTVAGERLSSAAGIVRNHIRVKTTGTFSSATFATGIHVTPG